MAAACAKLNVWMASHRTMAVVFFACTGLAVGLACKLAGLDPAFAKLLGECFERVTRKAGQLVLVT